MFHLAKSSGRVIWLRYGPCQSRLRYKSVNPVCLSDKGTLVITWKEMEGTVLFYGCAVCVRCTKGKRRYVY